MNTRYAPVPQQKRLDEIASLIKSLTYGEMIELAGTIWQGQVAGSPVAEDGLPGMLHRWAMCRATQPRDEKIKFQRFPR
jgi:hypothetical protein